MTIRFWCVERTLQFSSIFPEEIVEDEVKPKNWNYIFVEPGVIQRLSYITIIDAEIRTITARAEFYYKQYKPHRNRIARKRCSWSIHN